MAEPPAPDIELITVDRRTERPGRPPSSGRWATRWLPVVGVACVLAGMIGLVAVGGDEPLPEAEPVEPLDELRRPESAAELGSTPAPLLAAARYQLAPSGETLRGLLSAIGGTDALVLGQATGAFDVVEFNPADPDRLLATVRSSYGDAQNQDVSEVWTVDGALDGFVGRTGADAVVQLRWAPDVEHDYATFNADGTITMWVHGGGDGFAPRRAVILDGDEPALVSAPLYAARSTVAGGKLWVLTGDGDYYSTATDHIELVVDDGTGPVVLGPAAPYGWIDSPAPGLVVLYPAGGGVTAVWDAASLEPLPDHPLAGRRYQRIAVSADGLTAVGVTGSRRLHRLALPSGEVVARFGSVDPRGVSRPITLSEDGARTITVDRTGEVTLWATGEDEPVLELPGDAAQPRWVPERMGARSAAAVSPDASRVAVRNPARPETPVSWTVIDTDVDRWLRLACLRAGRALTGDERDELGLPAGAGPCDRSG